MMRKSLVTGILSGILLSGIVLAAQAASSSQFSLPEIRVSQITSSKDTYNAGGKVEGVFFVANLSRVFVEGLYYRVSLVKEYQANGLAKSFLDQGEPSEIFVLEPKQAKSMKFSYNIPTYISGDSIGVQIGVYNKQGLLLGWSDGERIKVIEGKPSLQPIKTTIVTNNADEFALHTAPPIDGDIIKSLTLEVRYKNPSSKEITATPQLKVISRFDPSKELQNVTAETKTISPGTEVVWSIAIPDMSMYSGSYVATLNILDDADESRAPKVLFAYLVKGQEVATVYEFSASKESLTKDEIFNISLRYSVAAGKRANNSPLTLTVDLFDEGDRLVSTYTASGNQLTGSLSQIMTATRDAKAIRGVVTVSRGDVILGQDERELSSDYALRHQHAKGYWPKMIMIGLVAIASAALLAWLRMKGTLTKRLFLIIFVVILAITVFAIGNENAQAFVQTGYDDIECYQGSTNAAYYGGQPTQYVSSVVPYDNSLFQTDASFNVTGSIYYPYGAPRNIGVTAAPSSGGTGFDFFVPSSMQPQFSAGLVTIGTGHGNQWIDLTIAGEYGLYCKNSDTEDCGPFRDNPAPSQFTLIRLCTIYTWGYIPYYNDPNQYVCEEGFTNVDDVCVPTTNGECGSSDGGSSSTFPSSGLCTSGESTDPVYSESAPGQPNVFWYCYDPNFSGTTASCSATITTVDGMCEPV